MTRWRVVVAKACGWLASTFLAAMMLVTVADVLFRKLANTPVRGTLELVELLLACTFFFALPASFLREDHIVVDMIDGWFPRAISFMKRAASATAVVMLAVIVWQSWITAADSYAFGDVTADLSLPKTLYWIPVLVGLAGAAVAAFFMIFVRDDCK